MSQRNEDWYKIKQGKFSASRASELLTNGSRKMTEDELIAYKIEDPKGRRTTIDCIGDSLDTYALEMAIEELYGSDPEDTFLSYDMERGVRLEPFAFELFKERRLVEFIDVQEIGFIPYSEHAGASPDGVCSNNTGLEIKCPKRKNYFKLVANGISEIDPKYIDQMQFQMMCTGVEATYFFCYYEGGGNQFGHEILITRDDERIKLISERLDIAIERKLAYMDKIKNNKQ